MERADQPGPNQRRGPRPLLLHLALASWNSGNSRNWNVWLDVWKSWNAVSQSATNPEHNGTEAPGGAAFPAALATLPPFLLPGASGVPAPDACLLAGIAAYRRHPFRRLLNDPPSVWREGGSQILDFGPDGAPAILFVPSLVNRAYILDLLPGHSMMRAMAEAGVRPLLLDWGYPGEAERNFTMTDYIAGRLSRALAAAAHIGGGKVDLAGYCMGGLMTVAAAQQRPDLVRRLVLLATPWDFWAGGAEQAKRVADLVPFFEPAFAFGGALPVDGLQLLFSLLDPGSVANKYRDFGRQDQTSARARMFVAMEDWLNDGVPLAAPVARETLGGWYGGNTPHAGTWRVAGLPVTPETLSMPSFVAIPGRDRLVPPSSALPLAGSLPSAAVVRPHLGHIGMVAGSSARAKLWDPLLSWLRETGP